MSENVMNFVCKELDELDRKAKSGDLSLTDLQYADLLAHYKKDALAVEKMENEDGYSGYYPYTGGSYRMRGSGSRSYSRRRDGRYSGERGYSRSDLADKMRELIDEAPDDHTRQEIQRMIDKLDG